MQGKQVHGLNQHLNTIHSKTKYTLEIKQNNTINFLDLMITKEDNRHKTIQKTKHYNNHHTQHITLKHRNAYLMNNRLNTRVNNFVTF
jgi:hypothetical protein